ncbi:MAG TPA: response regulator [Oligoflexus sp.]|uniref:ATP-binding response regulator n=1 Tax=Oligoflexus sp. TaxID=1971216 RepID=UPI002D7F6F68|nr:response regulator [Oligoflexus sp.]HET9240546.1 response regulator [Oligoflexus sp.]
MKTSADHAVSQEVAEERKHAESMILVLVWLLLEFGQQQSGPTMPLWKGSFTFFLAWLFLTTRSTSVLRWLGLPIVSFLVWFPTSISSALIQATVLGGLFLLFSRWHGRDWKLNTRSIMKALGLTLLLSVLRVGLNQILLLEYPLVTSDVSHLLWNGLPAVVLHATDLLATIPFYIMCLIPLLLVPFHADQEKVADGPVRAVFSWKGAALGGMVLVFWGLKLAHQPIPFSSPWLWIVGLLLASWAGMRGVVTAIYGAYIMNFVEFRDAQDLYNRVWQLMGLAALTTGFAQLSLREKIRIKNENTQLENQRKNLQEKLFAEERQHQMLKARVDSSQRLVLRSIQELHAHLTPVVLSSKLLSQQENAETEGIVRILQSSADKQMQVLQSLQDAIQMPGQGMQGPAERVVLENLFNQLLPNISEVAAARSVTVTLGNIASQVAVQSWPFALQESMEHLLRHLILFGDPESQILIRVYAQPQKVHLQFRHSNYTNRQGVLAGLVDGNLMSKEALALAVNFDVGLYTACRLLESMGGQLSIFEKAAQHHLTFAIQLPAAQEEDVMVEAAAPAPAPVPDEVEVEEELPKPQLVAIDGRLPPRRLLLVEDDKMTQELLQSILKNTGIEVRSHGNAQEAYESFCSFRPDVVIADLGLPDSNGFELMKRLRSVAKYDFYAIAFSANNHRNVLKTALSAGFDSFLPKPLAIHDLCRALRIA